MACLFSRLEAETIGNSFTCVFCCAWHRSITRAVQRRISRIGQSWSANGTHSFLTESWTPVSSAEEQTFRQPPRGQHGQAHKLFWSTLSGSNVRGSPLLCPLRFASCHGSPWICLASCKSFQIYHLIRVLLIWQAQLCSDAT